MGQGFLAVQAADGSEGYTRAGGLNVGAGGILVNSQGLPVMGDGGPIAIPPDVNVTIAKDGTVSAVPSNGRGAVNVLGRLKLVNPPEADLVRSQDALFRLAMISHARAFETHMKMLSNADQNDRQANQLLSMNR
jgi:flagellar basal-body rod protein FlgF